MKHFVEEYYDAAVIGAGHAGCEAALALARRGLSTVIFTMNADTVAMMPCNPNIGGTSKGHLVREVDALGGEMAKNIDRTFIQSKMLNTSKGPAVHSLRAQADKAAYSRSMKQVLEREMQLDIRQAEAASFIIEEEGGVRKIAGVVTVSGAVYHAKAVVLASGVYLKARCIYGDVITESGPNGTLPATHLSKALREAGIELVRFKTGTPARIAKSSIDFSKMEIQPGDVPVTPFSFSTDPASVQIEQAPCFLTYTNERTHEIIRENIDRSPLYGGVIHATGPRYCPSIEDKVMKFPDKDRHQVFIEPEGLSTDEMYIDGMSSSMPEDVQFAMYRSVAGLENARIVRNAYAIEYDCLAPGQLDHSLMVKNLKGLYSAGQVNGSSGYEEAAAQGIIAGINAAHYIFKEEPLVLKRSEAYTGVLIDDLVMKENAEPYRMMTSRAEYRLLLRQDNADLRLSRYGYEAGLVTKEQIDALEALENEIREEIARIERTYLPPSDELCAFLEKCGSTPLSGGASLADLIRRPELNYGILAPFDKGRPSVSRRAAEQVNIEVKYAGYIKRQLSQVASFMKNEERRIPSDIVYADVKGLRIEAAQKLERFRPDNIGQAMRLGGVTPADVSVLLIYLKRNGK